MEQYQEALSQALAEFDRHPTQSNLDRVYDAANSFQAHVGFLDQSVLDELTDLKKYVVPDGAAGGLIAGDGVRLGSVTLPWVGIAVAIAIGFLVSRKRGR